MSTQAHHLVVTDPAGPPDVHVTRDPQGGWQIDALVDGRVVASRHCGDWHRVERVRRTLAEARPPERPMARAVATAGRR